MGGSGDPLIIVHGGGGGGEAWLENADKLSGHYSVYIPDLPGYGGSEAWGDCFHLSEYVRFISDFADSIGLKRFHLLGHSIGGNIALEFAMRYPERVSRLVLVNSLGLSNNVGLWVRVLSSSFFTCLLGKVALGVLRALKWLLKTLFASVELIDPLPPVKLDIGRYIAGLKRLPDMKGRLANLKVPTLLVWGADDSIVPVSQAYAAAQMIPDCRLRVINGRHGAYSENSDLFCRTVVEFLSPESIYRPEAGVRTRIQAHGYLKRVWEPVALALSLLVFIGINRIP